MANPLMQKLGRDRPLFGLCNMYPSPGIIEAMGKGWDFIWIDAQHGQHQFDSVLGAVRAAEVIGVATVLRVPGCEPGIVGPLCDTAPSMIMAPMIDTADAARAMVAETRFPPLGNRSYGGRRAIDLLGADYHEMTDLPLMAQIETPEAIDNVDAIAAVQGVDVLFFGAGDIKIRLGLPINTPHDDPRIAEPMRRVAAAARRHGKHAACTAFTPDATEAALDAGYRMIVAGGDVQFIRNAATARLGDVRRTAARYDQAKPISS